MRRLPYFFLISLFVPLSSFSQLNNAFLTVPYSVNEHWLFTSTIDTSIGNWKYIAPLPRPLYGATCYFWQDSNKVLVCGGADAAGVPQRACYFYNIQTNSYQLKDSLPMGRALGKLVRVRDSLYLVGSIGSNFNAPDGGLFKYDPAADEWVIRAPTPVPALHEMAVCVWNDSVIVTIGGSTNAFNGATRNVRIYIPAENTWRTLGDSALFPITITSAHAGCIGDTIVVMGGFGTTFNDTVYKGYFKNGVRDSIMWSKNAVSASPFGFGVYRVGGGQWSDYILFGPALRNTTCHGQIWGYNVNEQSWRRFLPNTIDTAGNRPTIAVRTTQDSVYFYLFGGILNTTLAVTANSERYALSIPLIGITSQDNKIPERFELYQNYPNPFNPFTRIVYWLPKLTYVSVKVYDVLGREIATLVSDYRPAGKYQVQFDSGGLSSGIYICVLECEGVTLSRKMALIK
jgi:N-acetylneuraminic acid mutarotase